jgi:hypothetical protein
MMVTILRDLLQISIVKKGEAREPRETRELFRELALLPVPWEALGTGFCSRLTYHEQLLECQQYGNFLMKSAQVLSARSQVDCWSPFSCLFCGGEVGDKAVGKTVKQPRVGTRRKVSVQLLDRPHPLTHESIFRVLLVKFEG